MGSPDTFKKIEIGRENAKNIDKETVENYQVLSSDNCRGHI